MRQVVTCYIGNSREGKLLSYVWKGKQPLAVGDRVRVRNPSTRDRRACPLVEVLVVALHSDYQGYLVVIDSKV